MLRVSRPGTGILVVSQGQAQAVVRLLIWLSVVVLFYLVLLFGAPLNEELSSDDSAAAWHVWALLLVPLFLLPYLFGLIRAIRRSDELIFNGPDKIVSKGGKTLAAFTDIRAIELRTVHGTCEELRLSAVLDDGGSIALLETEASAEVDALAGKISELLQVPLTRKS